MSTTTFGRQKRLTDKLAAKILAMTTTRIEISDLIRTLLTEGLSLKDISDVIGELSPQKVYSRIHSKKVKVVAEIPTGYRSRASVEATLPKGSPNIHRLIFDGIITDEVLYRGKSYIKVKS